MKKYIFLTVIFLLGVFVLSKTFNGEKNLFSSPSPTPQALGVTKDKKNYQTINFENREYGFAFFEIKDTSKLTLVANYKERKKASELQEVYNCQFLVNAGFYNINSSPIGLFMSERKSTSIWQKNALLNAVLSINDFEIPRITPLPPEDGLRLALQSGPLLVENTKAKKLVLKNDDYERRIVAAVSGENWLYFLAIFDTGQLFEGPKLADLAEILGKISDKIGIDFADALNLDGGTASAYISKEVTFNELTPIGSFFCLR